MFNLLFLPFRVIRRFLWLIVWYSVYFLLRRPKLFIAVAVLLLFGILYSGWQVYQNRTLMVAAPAPAKVQERNKEIPAVTGNIKDGNSAFATNLLNNMQPFQRQAYSKEFYNAMQKGAANVEYRWMASDSVYGSIIPQDTFQSDRAGYSCRKFSELMRVDKENQKFTGIACQRQGGGWCKLRPGSTPVCGLQSKKSINIWWHNTKLKLNNLF
ncbi:MAG: hypothetical protein U1E36_01650 [Rickettsiales bacterium]